jgi:hypothetical protein
MPDKLTKAAQRYNCVAASLSRLKRGVRGGMPLCTVPIDGQAFGITMRLSRWRVPDKSTEFVTMY